LQLQKYNRELEIIVQECILTAIRESIPTESIIRAYMDESIEHEEEVIIEDVPEDPVDAGQIPINKMANQELNSGETMNAQTDEQNNIEKYDEIDKEIPPVLVPTIKDLDNDKVVTRLTFNDYDSVLDDDNNMNTINVPKDIERLEEISTNRAIHRKLEEEEDYNSKIQIHTDNIELSNMEITSLEKEQPKVDDNILLNDVEELF
jgi:hypothetical protein